LKKITTLLTIVFFSLLSLPALAEDGKMSAEQFEAQLKYRDGKIELPGGRASLNVPKTFRYLDPEDSRKVLEQAWGNPPGAKSLGMLFPANVSPLSHEGWGVVIYYDHDGHVSDGDAKEIDYSELLSNMQEQTREDSQQRVKQGYEAIDLVGWAEPPSYNPATHKMYWAKELKFGKMEGNTLNYNIRVLGREGVLVLNAIAGMNQMGEIKREMQNVIAFTNFNDGHRYEDFNASTDKVATYGLAALIGGAVAAKTGLLAKLIALLIAGKKIILIGLVAVAGFFSKLLGRKSSKKQEPGE